jgi:hypothetical protein
MNPKNFSADLGLHPRLASKCTESELQCDLEAGLKGCKEMAGPGGMGGTAQMTPT